MGLPNRKREKKIRVYTDRWDWADAGEQVNPIFDIKMINHTKKTIVPEKVTVLVSESGSVEEFVLRAKTVVHGLIVCNDGWENVKGCKYKYNFVPSLRGGYGADVSDSEFEFEAEVLSDGVICFSESMRKYISSVSGKDVKVIPYEIEERFFYDDKGPVEIDPDLFFETYDSVGFGEVCYHLDVSVAGVFEVEGITGEKSYYELVAPIRYGYSLDLAAGGGGLDSSKGVEICLRSESNSYVVSEKLDVFCEPNGVLRFPISFSADRSSNHRFRIKIEGIDGVIHETGSMSLEYLVPKSGSEAKNTLF